jgi:hypothetical protein
MDGFFGLKVAQFKNILNKQNPTSIIFYICHLDEFE